MIVHGCLFWCILFLPSVLFVLYINHGLRFHILFVNSIVFLHSLGFAVELYFRFFIRIEVHLFVKKWRVIVGFYAKVSTHVRHVHIFRKDFNGRH